MRLLFAVLLASVVRHPAYGQTFSISTIAGGGVPTNIPGTAASLYGPTSVAVDKAGNIYFADNHEVLRLNATTGVMSVAAGNGTPGFSGDNGLATSAQLKQPYGVALGPDGSLYIADVGNNRIRKVTNGVITTVAGSGAYGSTGDGGPATGAALSFANDVAVDSAGNLYISDKVNNRIRKVTNGVITTVAGNGTAGFSGDDGPATSAELDMPAGIAADAAGNLYVADNVRIRKVAKGVITTVAGGGIQLGDNVPATSAQFSAPSGVAVDSAGNLYITDASYNIIREVTNGMISTVAGDGLCCFGGDNGPATLAVLGRPEGITVDSSGTFYIADPGNYRVRRVREGVITTVAGNGTFGFSGDSGPASSAQLNSPAGLAVDFSGDVYIADCYNNRISKVSKGLITTVAGTGAPGYSGDNGPATAAELNQPFGVALDSSGNLYIADSMNNVVRKVSGGVITTVAGNGYRAAGFSGDNGSATEARLNNPMGVAVDSAGNLYIADSFNARIREVSDGVIRTIAGNGTPGFSGDGGPAIAAQLYTPVGVAAGGAGEVYAADTLNDRVRKIASGVITTVAGTGAWGFSGDGGLATSARLNLPDGVALDASGDLYIADEWNSRIRKVSKGLISTIAGSGDPIYAGDSGPATGGSLWFPEDVALDPAGNMYVADSSNNLIRMLTPGTAPAISNGGVVPIYSSVAVIQPGEWVSIYGSNLASGTYFWKDDFPTSLGGTSVTIDFKPAYLWFVSPTQINLQAPDDAASGLVSVVVSTASGSAESSVTLAPYAPSFSLLGDGRHVAGEIATPDKTGAYADGTYDLVGPLGTFSYNTRPVRAGETLTLYGVGFGPTNPSELAGMAFSVAAPSINPVTVKIGGVPAAVAFSGITAAGLFQFNLTVPSGTGSGDQILEATVNGAKTPPGAVVTVQ